MTAACALSACMGGPSAPIDHRTGQGAAPRVENRPVARVENRAPGAVTTGSSNDAAVSRIVTPAPPARPASPAVVLPERPDRIVIQPGDTLFAITERYRLTLEQVIEANALREPYNLVAGRTLILPQWPSYTVRAGDTVNEIAQRANVDAPSLLLLNYIEDPDNLRVGQVLILPELPESGMARAPAAPARPSVQAPTPTPAPAPGVQAPAQTAAVTSTAAATGAAGRFAWPARGEIVSTFGPKGPGQRNDGVNIRVQEGAPVRAAAAGTVVYAGNEVAGYGELVLVSHDGVNGGWVTAYAHNRRLLVRKDQRVAAGETIAEAGQTGSVDSPQLHFEVRDGVTPVDPMRYLPPA